MPILSSFALFVILQSWSLVLHLVSTVWYERQRSRYKNYWLLQLEQKEVSQPSNDRLTSSRLS